MKVAIKISAKNDINGNPRRGWIIYEVTPLFNDPTGTQAVIEKTDFVDEGYTGFSKVLIQYGKIPVLADIPVSPSYYKATKKNEL